jgi:SAM-dependent methyltransferase
VTADIFSAQPTDADLLAEIYDLEHDEVVDDLAFYREMGRRSQGPTLDLGCGSGRLFLSLLTGGARPLLGLDGSPALLRRAERRVETSGVLRRARETGRLRLALGDARRLEAALPDPRQRFRLIVAAGVLPHLDGPDEAIALLQGARRRLLPDGVLILDDVGPGELPTRDLPLSVDWTRELNGRTIVRRSQLARRVAPEGVRVLFSTLADVTGPDGTIARLPASYRLWYPSQEALTALVREADLAVELTYGSHELEPLDSASDRRIVVARRVEGSGAA